MCLDQPFGRVGPLARASHARCAARVCHRFREQLADRVVGVGRILAGLADQRRHRQRGIPGRGDGPLLGRTEGLRARRFQTSRVVGEVGDAASRVGLARQQAATVIGERRVAGRAARCGFSLDLRDALDAVDDDVVVRRRAPNRIGHGGRAVGVVGHLREFGIVRVRGADRAAQGVVGIGGVAHA
ncbi:hypothetical protein D9M68_763090 [compost metagenome]